MSTTTTLVGAVALAALLLPQFASAHGPQDKEPKPLFSLVANTEVKAKLKANGMQRIEGAVTAIQGTTLTVQAKNGGTYTVDASGAKFVRRFGAAMVIGDIQINDQLHVEGRIDGNTVVAKLVRDESLQARHGEFSGKVTTITGTSFVIQTSGRGTQTIMTTASTTIMKQGATTTLSAIPVGTQVKVRGVWNTSNNNVVASRIHIVEHVRSIRLQGTVESKTATSTFTLKATNGTTYTIDASQATLVRKAAGTTSLDTLVVGERVEVQGKHVVGSTAIKARVVKGSALPPVSATTTVSAILGAAVSL